MPQKPVGPVAAKKRPQSSERLRSMLMPTTQLPGSSNPFSGPSPSSLDEYAMRDYQYNPSGFTPEELAQYQQTLARDKNSVFPSRTDIGGEELRSYGIADPRLIARQDSVYTAARLDDAETLQRRKMINNLMQELGGIFGAKNVSMER